MTVLADGRDVGWLELGQPDGTPVFAFHGTPGSRLQLTLGEAPIRDAGVRLVCPDRPGYGLSKFQPRRRLVDWPSDVAFLADHLEIGDFAVMGISAGGPHAAVCAALLGGRVTAAAIVSGVGPLADPRASEGMLRLSQILTKLSRRRSPLVRVMVTAQVVVARRWPSRAIELMVKEMPEADAAILRRPEVRALFELDAARSSRTTAIGPHRISSALPPTEASSSGRSVSPCICGGETRTSTSPRTTPVSNTRPYPVRCCTKSAGRDT